MKQSSSSILFKIIAIFAVFILALVAFSSFTWKLWHSLPMPIPQKAAKDSFAVLYEVRQAKKGSRSASVYRFLSDSNEHIRRDDGSDNSEFFTIYDYSKQASFTASKSKRIYANNELYDPTHPKEFGGRVEVDEKSLSTFSPRTVVYLGDEYVAGYKCHHYGESPFGVDKFDGWYCPDLNCCVKTESGLGWLGTILGVTDNPVAGVDMKKYCPGPQDGRLFDLTSFRLVPYKEFLTLTR